MVARLLKPMFAALETLSSRRTRTDVLPHGGRSVTSIHDAVAGARTSGQLVFHYNSGGHFERVEWTVIERDVQQTP